jgi:hypothetical protein
MMVASQVPDIGLLPPWSGGRRRRGAAAAGPAAQDTLKVTLSALEKSELEPAFTR